MQPASQSNLLKLADYLPSNLQGLFIDMVHNQSMLKVSDENTLLPDFDEALKLIQGGQLNKAAQKCQEIAFVNRTIPRVLGLCAQIALQCKRPDLSIQWLEVAIQADANRPEYHFQLARTYLDIGSHKKALRHFLKVLSIEPKNAAACYWLGIVYSQQDLFIKASRCFQKALALNPNIIDARYALGLLHLRQGDLISSRDCFFRVTEDDSTNWGAWGNLCLVLRELGEFAAAKACGRRAVSINPRSCAAWHNLGNVSKDMQCYSDATACYEKALSLEPERADTLIGIGIAHLCLGNRDIAAKFLETALEYAPESGLAASNLYYIYRMEADWERAAIYERKVQASTAEFLRKGLVPDEPPFMNLTRCDDPRMNYAVAQAWSRDISLKVAKTCKMLQLKHPVSPCSVIRIGYLSNNFGDHPTSHISRQLYRLHDRSRFEIVAFSYGSPHDDSPYLRAIKEGCDKFIDIRHMSHVQAAKSINEYGIHILVDLVGFMKGERVALAALRPAPIQVRWLGMAGTTGADFFDYLISDRVVTPEEQQRYYTEKFVYLPYSYQINDDHPFVTKGKPLKSDVGLPEGSFVFCCFNTGYKIDAVIFKVWMNILKRCSDSVLWLMADSDRMKANLKAAAMGYGVEADRLIFASKRPKPEHLSRLSLADLGLDTRMVNGAASTSDALWAGVPVVTMEGRHFASRMSSSILQAIGLGSLVTRSLGEYENLAVRLAKEKNRLIQTKSRLCRDIDKTPLFDTASFVTYLEQAYQLMWTRYLDHEQPAIININSNKIAV